MGNDVCRCKTGGKFVALSADEVAAEWKDGGVCLMTMVMGKPVLTFEQ